MSKQHGFTIIELVIVVAIISIIAISAFAKLNNTQDLTLKGYQDTLLTALRSVQSGAMQDTRAPICYQLNFINTSLAGPNTAAFGPPTNNFALSNAANTCATNIDHSSAPDISTAPSELADQGMSLVAENGVGGTISYIRFNAMGRPFTDTANHCAPLCVVRLSIDRTRQTCINSEGFVYGC